MKDKTKFASLEYIDGYPKTVNIDQPVKDERPVVLFAAIYAPTYNSDYMVRGFEEAGYRVCVINWQEVRFNEGTIGLAERLLMKANEEQPELIFLHIQNKDVLNKELLEQLNKISFTISYTFDCRSIEKTEWMYELAPYVGLTLFSNYLDVQMCKELGIFNVDVLHSSADFAHYRKGNIELTDVGEIVFIGNNYENSNMGFDKSKERREMVDFMKAEFGDKFRVYGQGWEGSKIVNQQEEVLIYNNAKIAITHNNYYRAGYQSDRAYRAMASGVFSILQYYPEINKDFNSQVISTWNSFEMLRDECIKYLKDDELRINKAEAGLLFVRNKCSWKERVLKLKSMIKKIKS